MTSLDPHTSPELTPVCGEEAGSVPVIAGWVVVPSRDRMTAPTCHVKPGSPSKDGSWERWYLRWVLFLHTLSYPCGNLKCQGSWGGGARVEFAEGTVSEEACSACDWRATLCTCQAQSGEKSRGKL